jgi:hypothetical protein
MHASLAWRRGNWVGSRGFSWLAQPFEQGRHVTETVKKAEIWLIF